MKIRKDYNNLSKYARFSSIVIQMGVIISFFTWLGVYLDREYNSETGWWTIGLSLFGIVISLYIVINNVMKISNKDES